MDRMGRLKRIRDELLRGMLFVLIGVLIMSGMRLVEHIIPKPDVNLLICVTDKERVLGECKPFGEYLRKLDIKD